MLKKKKEEGPVANVVILPVFTTAVISPQPQSCASAPHLLLPLSALTVCSL